MIVAAVLGVLVITANQGERSLSAINTISGNVQTVSIPVFPHNVETCGEHRILATGMSDEMTMGEDHMPGRLIDVDRDTLHVVAGMDVGMHPAHVVCDKSGRRAYVTLSEENAVAVVDVPRMQTIAKIPTGAYPHGLRLSAGGNRLYVANTHGSSVSVIDTARLTEIARIKTGSTPIQVAPAPRGNDLFVTLSGENSVVDVDVKEQRIVKRLNVGSNPQQLTASRDGAIIAVANQGTAETPDSRVLLVSTDTLAPVAWVEAGNGPHGVAIDASRRAYVTNVYSNTLSVIDLIRHRVIKVFSVGKEPNGETLFSP
jgi:YVTN family beta-propeller protein